jgi:HAD superfamily hydrolase (TIGR01490 family)
MASREERAMKAILTEKPCCAAFDLENTLIASNVVESYAWLATRHLERAARARLVAGLLAEGPRLLRLDRRDRSDFLRAFYRRYEGAPIEQLRFDGYELFSDLLGLRAFPEAIARVRRHRALGHKTLLITGALDFVVEPLRPLFDEIVCAHMGERDGLLTGELTDSPPTGEARALLLEEFARGQGLSLADTIGYADSTSDLPMLEASGFPVVVNPEAKLAAIARRRGWFIEHWERAAGGPRRTLAIATRRPGVQTRPATWLKSPAGRQAR